MTRVSLIQISQHGQQINAYNFKSDFVRRERRLYEQRKLCNLPPLPREATWEKIRENGSMVHQILGQLGAPRSSEPIRCWYPDGREISMFRHMSPGSVPFAPCKLMCILKIKFLLVSKFKAKRTRSLKQVYKIYKTFFEKCPKMKTIKSLSIWRQHLYVWRNFSFTLTPHRLSECAAGSAYLAQKTRWSPSQEKGDVKNVLKDLWQTTIKLCVWS